MSSEEINITHPDEEIAQDLIAKGGFGKVYKDQQNGEIFARKEVIFDRTNPKNVDDTIHEIEILKGLSHTNIIKIKNSYINPDYDKIYIYTKYYERGDLMKLIKEKRKRREDFSLKVYIYVNIYCAGDLLLYARFNKWIEIYSW